jgi:hypothetical protein
MAWSIIVVAVELLKYLLLTTNVTSLALRNIRC